MCSRISKEQLNGLQHNPSHIRNLCIIAHVDHGKTTLSDSLVSSNGIIPEKLAGKVRYLDSKEEEQRRGITMESSAISLFYRDDRKQKKKVGAAETDETTGTSMDEQYLINLIDSPGHIDFSPDVSTAVRLCDGALIVVDVLEGVCAQTTAVLRQAWREGVQPCLVLNKIDRLILERQLTPSETFDHLRRLIEQINAVMSAMYTSEVMRAEVDEAKGCVQRVTFYSCSFVCLFVSTASNDEDKTLNLSEEKEASILFDPVRGNVVFASAFDCWGFSLKQFAQLCSKRLQVPAPQLRRALWGEFYFNHKVRLR